jgi:Kdo2-lipid IVA lauroyltransferase/acyltransferase
MGKFVRLFAKPILFLLFILPRPLHRFISWCLGVLWFDILRVRRKVVLDNLKIAYPNLSDQERLKIARESMFNMGRTIVDVMLLPFINQAWSDKHMEIRGYEHYEKARAAGKGVIFLSLHLGNGDMAVCAMSLIGMPVHVITKTFKSEWLNELWFSARKKHGSKYISDRKSSFDILRVLRNNEIVVFVLDQYMGPPLGVKTKFFGKETGTAMGLALFHERADCPVLPVYSYYENGKAICQIDPPIPLESKKDRDETILHMTQVYCDHIEKLVRARPGQWMWVHRRWKEFG